MSRTFPRWPKALVAPRIEEFATATWAELEQPRMIELEAVIWPPTGPQRVEAGLIAQIRTQLRSAAVTAGYKYGSDDGPGKITADQKVALDHGVATVLRNHVPISRHEAAHPGVWAWLTTTACPELVRWRFEDHGKVSSKRYGPHIRRNFLSRLWWRADSLYDEGAGAPLWLLEELGEDEQVQITERPNIGGDRRLAVCIGRTIVGVFSKTRGHKNRSALTRDVLKRILRRLPWMSFQGLDDVALAHIVHGMVCDAFEAFGYDVDRPDGTTIALGAPALTPTTSQVPIQPPQAAPEVARAPETCQTCEKPLNRTRYSRNGRWKTCPRCSKRHGSQHIYLACPDSFGKAGARRTVANPEGFQSYCTECRRGRKRDGTVAQCRTCSELHSMATYPGKKAR